MSKYFRTTFQKRWEVRPVWMKMVVTMDKLGLYGLRIDPNIPKVRAYIRKFIV